MHDICIDGNTAADKIADSFITQSINQNTFHAICRERIDQRLHDDGRPSVYNRYKQCQKVRFLSYAWKYTNSSAERQLCGSEFQTEGALTLKALADNESAIRGTESSKQFVSRS